MPNAITRAFKLFKTARGIAALRKADDASDKELAKAALANLFADARGVTMKIGQLFSEMEDGSPFDKLAKGVDPFPLASMLPTIEKGLGRPFTEIFVKIEEHAVGASLGQVHKAWLLNGDEVAVKIRYPGITLAVDAEMKIAGLMPSIGPAKKWGIDLAGYKRTLKENMDRELDYRSEAERQIAFKKAIPIDGLCVPTIYPDLCSDGVLVQSWENGSHLDEVAKWPASERGQVAHLILKTFLHSLFIAGEIHGDPHLGNSFYRQNSDGAVEMALLDYGCIISINEQQRNALYDLVLACRDGGVIPAFDLLVDLGFDGEKLSYIQDALPDACKIILKPFMDDRPFDAKNWDINAGFSDLFGDLKWWFRSAGPTELLLGIRAFHGVISQLESLQCTMPWWTILAEVLGDARNTEAQERLVARREQLLQRDLTMTTEEKPIALAEELCVRVTENSRQVVFLAMPGASAYKLVDIMPDDVIEYIKQTKAVDLDELNKRVIETQAAPQMLFEMDRGEKHYSVWLK